MGLDIWYPDDVVRILAATQETMKASQAAGGINPDYQLGFGDALRAVALAFGVQSPPGADDNSNQRQVQMIDVPSRQREVLNLAAQVRTPQIGMRENPRVGK